MSASASGWPAGCITGGHWAGSTAYSIVPKIISSSVARHADDEHIAQPLIENDLRRQARIGARQDDGVRVLTGVRHLAPPPRRLIGMIGPPRDKAIVAAEERGCAYCKAAQHTTAAGLAPQAI